MVGVFGLLVFMLFLFLNINHARNSGIFIPVAIIMFYAIVMFSENILERQEGVIYFALLINLLYFLSRENQQVVRIKHSQEELLKAIS
jgi:Ca2+/Na+ antiporter